MARYTVTNWQDIPSMVEARDGAERHKVQLSARFQELIDLVAMRCKLAGTDAYLQQWTKHRARQRDGSAQHVAQSVAQELEERFESIKAQAMKRK
jgi:hypothetical protein